MRHCHLIVLSHKFTQLCLNNVQTISLPSLEDLEVVSTSMFSFTRDLIAFEMRSSSSLRKEGRRGGGKKRGMRKREGGRKGGEREEREREEREREEGQEERINIQEHRLLTVYARFTFMSSSTSSLRTVMPLSFSSISATCFSSYNTVTMQQFQSQLNYQQPSHGGSLAG